MYLRFNKSISKKIWQAPLLLIPIALLFSSLSFASELVKRENIVFKAPADFYFGLAGAPAHLEDELDDIWLDFANQGGVAAYSNIPFADRRLNFWTKPEIELDLVKESGVSVFRMGIDWGRIFPNPPKYKKNRPILETLSFDKDAVNRYKEIIELARSKGLKVMLSLFHHSIPKWMVKHHGWKSKYSTDLFLKLTEVAVDNFQSQVDDWVTFNEPAVFSALTYAAGIWPPGSKQDNLAFMKAFGIKGAFKKALDNMVRAHKAAYLYIKENDRKSANGVYNSQVGVAHNVALYTANNFLDLLGKRIVTTNLVDEFPNRVIGYLDFLGINYYGEEIVAGTSVSIKDDREYSESGRTVA